MQAPRILHSTNQAGHALRARSHSGRLCMRADRACRAEMVFAPADWLKSERLIPHYENLPRAPGDNFYYAQGDALLEMASKHRFHWSVARPYTIIWYGPGGRDEYGNIIGELRDPGPGNRNPLCVLRVAAVVQWTRRHDRRSASRRPLRMGTPEPAKQSRRELTRMGGMEPVRWGVLGTSKFAREWIVPGMMKSLDVRVAAVGSRTRAKADSFAKALGIPMACGSYEDLLNDPNVEAIYNPLPNHLHVPMTIAAMRAGKHVLCEKADCADRRRGGIAQDGSEGIACRRSIYGSTPSPMARSTKIDSRGKFGTDPHRPGLLLVLSRRPR